MGMTLNPFILIRCSFALLSGLTLFAIFALGAALYSEVALGLEPCILCVYQRIPYLAVIIFGLIGLALKTKKGVAGFMIGLSGLALFINSGIALYHSGVEQAWWTSALEGCAVPAFGDEPQSIIENIMSAPTGNCAEIPWQDPIFGFSMANYNVLVCLGLALICAAHLLLRNTHKA
jgi:disulfide bond formation protein DsbB